MRKSELDLTKLKKSYETLKTVYDEFVNEKDNRIKEFIKDSCIKRFEYTYETSKKIMNKFLKKEYDKSDKELTINNIFREMYNLDFIQNFENWNEYRIKRNNTSHEYDDNLSYEIIEILPNFINDVNYLITNLENSLEEE